jgi:hypothetical protein
VAMPAEVLVVPRPGAAAYFLFAALTAAPTMSFVEGAAAMVFGTGLFGFLASRFPCFFSVAMISSFAEAASLHGFQSARASNLVAPDPDHVA